MYVCVYVISVIRTVCRLTYYDDVIICICILNWVPNHPPPVHQTFIS